MATMTKKEREAARQDAITQLRALYKPGDSVQMVLTDKTVTVLLPNPTYHSKHIQNVSRLVALACGWPIDKDRWAIKLTAARCPTSRNFWVSYSLGCVLFPKGFEVTENTTHRNGAENGSRDTDGGYALGHWVV